MIKSMTGFGKAEFEINNKKITIEIKALNSKQADINTRIPQVYREKEMDIRREITDVLVRGKIDFAIYLESLGETGKRSNLQGWKAVLSGRYPSIRLCASGPKPSVKRE